MQLYRRPPEPSDFSVTVQKFKETVEQFVKAQQKVKRRGGKAASKKTRKVGLKNSRVEKRNITFKNVWKAYKAIFAHAQFHKCAFCESTTLETGYGDVEHYRPKGEIWAISDDLIHQGQQQQASSAVKNRRRQVVSSSGYWWLAYEWSNYLFSCAICNQTYKGSFFPVKENPRPVPPKRRPTKRFPKETPLLLNPFDRRLPQKHLQFMNWGQIAPRKNSLFGIETIRTCGLDRYNLVLARREDAERAYHLARELRNPLRRRESNVLQDCYKYGREDHRYSGMVRAILEDVGGVDWKTLVRERAKELATQLRHARAGQKRGLFDMYMEEMGRSRFEHSKAAREIFKRTCGMSWGDLIERCAYRLTQDIQRCSDHLTLQKLQRDLYDLAAENFRYAARVKKVFEIRSQKKWSELQREVEAQINPIKKLEINASQ